MGLLKKLKEKRVTDGDILLPGSDKSSESAEGRIPAPIGEEEIRKAAQILREYKDGKANLERRIVENEQWYKLRHWEQMRGKEQGARPRPEPASAWLFNSIANKHADAMDNFPEPAVLPREESDQEEAKRLSSILPVILDYNSFEDTYSNTWWYKLKSGTAVYAVVWDKNKENGLGDVDIRQMDVLNCFWEPGIKDIQQSRHFFTVELVDNDVLESQYPKLSGKLGSGGLDIAKYIYDDTVDTTKKTPVIDWYYKSRHGTKNVLHYCKFCNDVLLYSSENDPALAQRGFYDHGMYPFVFDTLFVEEGTPCGFGYIDIMKDPQMYIDKLNQAIIENTLLSAKKRYIVGAASGINEEEFADLSNTFIHSAGKVDDMNFRELQTDALPSAVINIYDRKVDELKETSGNRDFSQGGTTSGVTAASAIAALQEAGSKLSRDMIKSSYRAHTKICRLVVELIRQFYDEPRCFRITGEDGKSEFAFYDNSGIKPQEDMAIGLSDSGSRKPIFDINISAQKKSPFSRVAQNELAKELYSAGMFNPQMVDQALIALDMMDFEGKDKIIEKISQNGTLAQQMQQMQEQMAQMAQIIDAQNGTTLAAGVEGVQQLDTEPPNVSGGRKTEVNPLGAAVQSSAGNTAVPVAKNRAQAAASPQ
jgi:hypothetical protein